MKRRHRFKLRINDCENCGYEGHPNEPCYYGVPEEPNEYHECGEVTVCKKCCKHKKMSLMGKCCYVCGISTENLS